MDKIRTQALVLGAGPGGYPCAIRLAQLGKETLIVDKSYVGGVCLNVGCIPSKTLIAAAKQLDKAKHGAELGIVADNVRLDFGQMMAAKDSVVNKLTSGVKQLLKANGVKVMLGTGRLVSAHEVEVTDSEGKTLIVEAESIVLATGSRPIEIPGFPFDEKRILSSTGALALTEVPPKLVVIGGGYIGLELAMLYAKLGSKVTVLEATDQLLPGTDRDLVDVVAARMKKIGITVHLGAKALGDGAGDGRNQVRYARREGATDVEERVDADKVLVVVGRRPNTENLGLEAVGVAKTERGFIAVDRRLATSVAGIYAIGDVVGQPMLAHKASKDGEVCAEVVAGKSAELDVRAIPAVVFTDPEIATCGLSEGEAAKQGRQVKVSKFPMAALGRALSMLDTQGFVKVITDPANGQVLGISAVGAGVGDLMGEAALAIEMGALAEDLAMTVHAHPTFPEAIMEAAKVALDEPIHIMRARPRPAKGAAPGGAEPGAGETTAVGAGKAKA